jgi:hypothetical protein
MFMFTELHKERLLKTLQLVKENPEHWNQETWHCGTSHCFAGFGDCIARAEALNQDISFGLFSAVGTPSKLHYVDKEWYGLSQNSWSTIVNSSNTLSVLESFVTAVVKGSGDIDLSGVDLSNENLNCVDFGGANLSGANLSGANLSGANLSGANLSGANLEGANLEGANLSGANLEYTT